MSEQRQYRVNAPTTVMAVERAKGQARDAGLRVRTVARVQVVGLTSGGHADYLVTPAVVVPA